MLLNQVANLLVHCSNSLLPSSAGIGPAESNWLADGLLPGASRRPGVSTASQRAAGELDSVHYGVHRIQRRSEPEETRETFLLLFLGESAVLP
jgi:hypothetical protein